MTGGSGRLSVLGEVETRAGESSITCENVIDQWRTFSQVLYTKLGQKSAYLYKKILHCSRKYVGGVVRAVRRVAVSRGKR